MSTPGPIRLEVPDLVHAVPGGPFEFDVRVTHLGAHDTSVLVRVVGALVGLEPARVVDLPAGQPVTTSVRMALPDGMSPGQHRVVVEVVERTVGQVVEAAEVMVAIARTRGISITMTPATVSRRRRGKYRALISNHDDVEQRLRLKPVADRPGLTLLVSPDEVTLAPGESAAVSGRLQMKGFWVGQLRERWFTLLGESSGASVYGRGLVLQKPIISRSITRLVGLIAVLAVWLTGTLVVMRLLEPVTDDAATGADAAVDSGADGPNIPFGDGETKATITVTGAVTATPDGSGVTVLYRPVTLADTDAAEGKATPTAEETEVAGLRTETGPDGAFEVAGLDANGIFEFRFAKAGHNTLTRLVQPNGADVTLEVALEVGSGVISGVVVGPLGRPRGGVTVTLSDGAITYTTATPSQGDDAGRFTFNNLSTPGTYVLDARATGFGLASTVVELESGGVKQDVVLEISPDIGVLSGRVTSTAFETLASVNQLPAKGVMITATDGTVTRTTSTLSEGDLAGTFRLVGLPLNRTYTVTYEGVGYSPRTELVDFGLDFEPLEVSLIPSTGRVRGTITTPPDTVSPAAVAVTLASPENTYKSTDAISADGDLLLTGIAPGTYVAVFQSIGLADQVRDVTVSAGQTSVLDVDMERPPGGPGFGTIEVAITDAASLEPITANVTMRFRSAACGSALGSSGVCTWNASGGALTISNLEAGTYTLGFTQVGYRPDLTTVDVTPGQTVDVEMALQPLGSVQGIVQDADGGALQGVNLILYEANADDTPGAQVATARVNDKGEYRFRRVMFSRNYVLSATLSGYSSALRPITGAVASTVNLDITLRSESQIAGQLQTLDLVSGDTDPVSLDKFTVFLRTGVGTTTSAWVDLLPQGLVRTLGGYRFGVTPNKIDGVTTSASAKYAICIQRNPDGVFDPALCDTGPPEFVQVFDDDGQGIEIRQGELKVRSATFTPFPASVSGVVRLPNGATVPEGTAVELRRVDFDNKVLDTFTTITDRNGRFGFENMAPTTQINGFKPPTPQPNNDGTATATGSASSWRIQVRSESGSYNGLRFDLGPNAKYDMDVRMLEGTGSLEFFMMDDFGLPIEDVVVYVMKTSTGAQNVNYDDLRTDRCGNLPGQDRFGTDIALTANVPMRGCTGPGGSIKFDVLTAPVQYYVAIGMADSGGFAEILKQVIPVRVGIDAVEARSLRQTWYYGDINVLVDAADPDRVPTSQLVALANQGKLTISYQLIATASATPIPTNNNLKCYRENVYLWQVPTPTVTEGLTPDGECYINDMRPGSYRVTAVLSDPAMQKILQTTTSAVAIVQPGREKAVVPLVIPVVQRELQVRVIDGATNTTLSGATVVVSAASQPPVAVKSTGNDGSATFSSTSDEMPPPGIVFVTVGYPGFATTSASLNVRSGEQQTITVSLATSVAEAKVAVVDTNGNPVTGASVTVDGLTILEASCVVPLPGWYCLRNAPAGIATVNVSKVGYRPMSVPMAIANPGGGTVTVILGATKGTLFVDAVDAATGAEVDLSTWSVTISDTTASAYNATTKTFGNVEPGLVRVFLVPPGGSPYAPTTLSATAIAGTTTSATARLNRVSEGLVITVVDTLGNAIPGATVTAGNSGVLPLCPGGIANRYCWSSATPGVVSVLASKAGYTTVLLYTTVDGNGTGSISLVLRQLTGNILVNVAHSVTGVAVAISPSNVTIAATTPACATTGTVGQCRFDDLDSGTYTVIVSGVPGFQDATVRAGAPLDGRTGIVNVALIPTTARVEVSLRSPSGLAITGASVTVSGTTLNDDGGGRYSANVPLGITNVEAEATGYLPANEPLVVTVNGASASLVLNRVTAPLRVRVVDELGTVVPGSTVTVSVGTDVVTMTACDDAWCGAAPLGIASVTASASGYTTVQVLTTVSRDGGATAVVLRALGSSTGEVVLVVNDARTGQPLTLAAGVNVTATNSAASSAPPVNTTEAASGRYGLVGYETGLWTVTVSADGYLTRVVTVRIRAGISSDLVLDLASNAYALEGTVASAVGGTATSALASATVSLTDGVTTLSAVTDATGRYVFANVTAGAWTVSVDAAWATANGYDLTAASSEPVSLTEGGPTVVQDLVVDAKPGGLSVTVLAATGAPASGVDMWVDLDRDGQRDAGEFVASNLNGLASLSAIPAGVYQVVLSDSQQRYATTSALVLVERDLTSALTFRMASWGVTVTVGVEIVPIPGQSGAPVTLWVKLVGASGATSAVSTVSNGAMSLASFENVPADTYDIELSADNVTFVGEGQTLVIAGVTYVVPDLESITVESEGVDVSAGTITLERATVEVTVMVVGRNGAAINGAQVGVTGAPLLTQRTSFTTASGQAVVSLPADAQYDVVVTLQNHVTTTGALSVGTTATTYNVTLLPSDAFLEVVAVDAASPSTQIASPTVWAEELVSGSMLGGHAQALYPGRYRVRVSAPGYIDYVTTITLAPGEVRVLTAPMTSNAPGGVRVSLRTPSGATVAAVPSTIFLVDSSGSARNNCVVQSDPSVCAFTNVPAGPYSVSLSASGYNGFEAIAVSTGVTTSATVVVNFTGTLWVKVRAKFIDPDDSMVTTASALSGATVTLEGSGETCITSDGGAVGTQAGVCFITGLDPSVPRIFRVSGVTGALTPMPGISYFVNSVESAIPSTTSFGSPYQFAEIEFG